jgi:hypothetical protein
MIGFNTNPAGFSIAERDDGQISVSRTIDVTIPETALVN